MSERVGWVLQVTIKDGQLESFRSVMEDMVAATNSNEPGTIGYEWFISEDDSTVHIHERFADSDAALAHLGNFGSNFAERFMGAIDPAGMALYGNASEDLRSALAPMGAVHYPFFGGFVR